MTRPKPIVFMGSPATAVPTLRALAAHPACRVAGVFTQPDRPAGRHRRLQPSAVRAAADALAIPVATPEQAGSLEALAALRAWAPELVIVCAYGRLLPQRVLDVPRLGAYNVHFSLLPRWRGASPVQAAILAGDAVTGVSLQRMVLALDAGAIAAETSPLPILARDTAATLADRLAAAAAELVREHLVRLLAGDPPLREQDPARVTLCRTIRKEQGAVDWAAETAIEVERKRRAFTPWPGCYTYLDRRRLALIDLEIVDLPHHPAPPGLLLPGGLVTCREGSVRLLAVKAEGKAAMPFAAFANGMPDAIGRRLAPVPAA
ncbi:MAG: methionyl-tRNA formyltransferase [Candidatus Lambdaproteobacteria bacterium]|nr:methionyl-tRNA formyltransferase [Candidatus Lambdaproteobacteria bacterium]